MAHQTKGLKNSLSARHRGFALPLAMGLGFVMVALATTATIVAHSDRKTSLSRRETGASMSITEAGIARLLTQLRADNNSVLLNRNYDPLNARTGRNFLGPDGILNSGDETNQSVDQWTNFGINTIHPCVAGSVTVAPDINMTGNLGADNQFTLKAYRYNSFKKEGTLLVGGSQGQSESHILIRFSVLTSGNNFPGMLMSQGVYLQGRTISGSAGNLFFNFDDNDEPDTTNSPTLRGKANSSDRSTFLDAIFSGTQDGYNSDPVSGDLTACSINHGLSIDDQPEGTKVKSLGKKIESIVAEPGVNSYEVSKIEMKEDEVLTVDTTLGSVHIYVKDKMILKDDAKIINVRTDGKPPKASDLRIIGFKAGKEKSDVITLYDETCIENAFIYNATADLQLQTSGPGCPGTTANIVGVVWAEDLLSSPNHSNARQNSDKNKDVQEKTTSTTAGIVVPEDLSGFDDLLTEMNWPTQHKFGEITSWQRVRL
jgi:hypothetical protein